MSKFLKLLKSCPLLDLGTGSRRRSTKSKIIALKYASEFFKSGNNALDLGCGDGFWSEKLKQIGYQTTSADMEKKYPEAQIIDADKPLTFPDNSFNLCWSLDVIEHLSNPFETIKEIRRISKPNGAFIITTPNSYFWLYSFFKIFGLTAKDLQRQDHKHFFHYNDIKKLLPNAQIYGFFPYAILKFKIKNPWMIKWLSPSFVAISQTPLK